MSRHFLDKVQKRPYHMSTEDRNRMTPQEIRELMDLKRWSEAKLAAELNLSQYAVQKWLAEGRRPSGPASILMRQWLIEARKQAAATV